MSEESASAHVGEIDALKWYVWGMVGVSVVASGFVWYYQKKTDELQRTVDVAKKSLGELAEGKHEISQMLGVYKKNREDQARDEPLTWFQSCWKAKGIEDKNVQLDAWKVPPDVGEDGTYYEEKIGLKFSSKNPLRREQIGQLLHEIESRSTRLRVLTLKVNRAGREETLAEDTWTGGCEIGYRYPKVKD
jgi:hypothetical protein